MPVTEFLPNSNPRDNDGVATSRVLASLAKPQQLPMQNDFCYCARDCPYVELAFADLSDSSDYKNDKSSFLFDRVASSSTIDFELWKDGAKIADLNTDALGTYYPAFDEKPFYKGFVLDWNSVAGTHGFGYYQFRAQQSILGVASEFQSRDFRLLPYSDLAANKTVRITAVQSGDLGRGLDYTNLIEGGWHSSYRVEGLFGMPQYTLETSEYEDEDRVQRQNFDNMIKEWTLELKLIPSEIANWLIENAGLANYLLITDYNIYNFEIYRELPVVLSSPEEIKYALQKRRARYTLKMQDYQQDLIKRNF